ncbi:hypothetical protein D9V41_08810 [Aeromicrobium phragmitis]|uniref:DUF7927 domain-containing protein n=1 Tax=Aeromicrobium phragmitis TaxID=2478914 RepID=A0A3L8PKR8_9ACTN|nr:hypothetical protein [Aeromicrobium phragmitis]RLV55985.1 hypothetical protein D9V41_08810 [Aeromicrobium phragmitis]
MFRRTTVAVSAAAVLSGWLTIGSAASAEEPSDSVSLPSEGLEVRSSLGEIGGTGAERTVTVNLVVTNVSGEAIPGPLRLGLEWADTAGWRALATDGLSHSHTILSGPVPGARIDIAEFPAGGELTIGLMARLNTETVADGALVLHMFTSRGHPTELPASCAAPQAEWSGCVPLRFELPLHQVSLTKSATAVTDEQGVVTAIDYTVLATNDGIFDFDAAAPPVVVDDLSGVLDDGELDGDPTASTGSFEPSSPGTLRWSGPLPAGDTVELTYRVAVAPAATLPPAEAGDRSARNVVRAFNAATDVTDVIACGEPTEATCAETTTPLEPVVASVKLAASALEVEQGDAITLSATGFSADGSEIGDVTEAVTLTSDVDTDVIEGSTVRFPSASPHVITGTLPNGVSGSVTITVRPVAVPSPRPPEHIIREENAAESPRAVARGTSDSRPLPDVGGPEVITPAVALALIAVGLLIAKLRRRAPSSR